MCKFNISKEQLQLVYCENQSLNKTANILGVSSKTIKRRMIEYGLEYKPKIRHTCNENFFSESQKSHLQYYWAGFIAADGNLYKHNYSYVLSIKLATRDIQHLNLFKEDINSTAPILNSSTITTFKNRAPKEYFKSTIQITSKKIFNDLMRFNIVPAKTYIYKPPEFLKTDEYLNSFILGLIDGDGCAHINKNTVTVSIVGTKETVSFVRDVVQQQFPEINCKIYKRGNFTYVYEFCGNRHISQFYDWLYSNNNRFLLRKQTILVQSKTLMSHHKYNHKDKYSFSANKQQLEELYLEHKNINKIASILGFSYPTITKYMGKYNLKYNKQKYSKDDMFFDCAYESENQFYWAGYLSGKSGIRKEKILVLSDSNTEKIEQLKSVMKISCKNTKFSISSIKIVEDLAKFGIVSNKDINNHIPNWLKVHKFVKYFIRGRLDAKSSYNNLVLEICGSKLFLLDLKDVLENNNIYTSSVPKNIGKNAFRLVYCGENAKKLYYWAYSANE
jgi:DNA-binding CsgD family transcriptional regulator